MIVPYPPSNTPLVDPTTGQLNSLWSAWFDGIYSNINITPVGSVFAFAGNNVPSGYFPCDGRALDKTKFADLYKTIGNTYGSSGNNFNLPNYTNKFPRGGATAGVTGGADSVTLSISTLPDVPVLITDPGHTHIFDPVPHTHAVTDPGHTHPGIPSNQTNVVTTGTSSGETGTAGSTGSAVTGITVQNASATGTNENATTGITAELKGGGQPVPTVPNYITVLYIIKY